MVHLSRPPDTALRWPTPVSPHPVHGKILITLAIHAAATQCTMQIALNADPSRQWLLTPRYNG